MSFLSLVYRACIVLFLFSCATSPPREVEPPRVPEEVLAPTPLPVEEEAKELEPVELVQESPPEQVEEIRKPVQEVIEEAVEEVYEVSEEVYVQTFNEIEQLIYKINTVIAKKQYDRWVSYLSKTYKKTYNSSETLDEYNQYPQLMENNIVLKSLKDYFNWVVVPSRSQAELDEIIFIMESRVIAYSSYEGQRAKLYEFERIDEEWKISTW